MTPRSTKLRIVGFGRGAKTPIEPGEIAFHVDYKETAAQGRREKRAAQGRRRGPLRPKLK
jgi:hypothetical protein